MNLAFYIVFCLAQILLCAKANKGIYIVIAPGNIYSNEKYTAAVSVHHISQPCQINVSISGTFYNEMKQVEVSQNEVKTVEFDVPSFEFGDYSLSTEGVNCLENFKNTTEIVLGISNKVAIQTDKGVYITGDEVNFRVLFMDKDLKPTEPLQNAVIWLEDPKRNIIKTITNFETIKGAYTGKIKISEFEAAGKWVLRVQNGRSSFSTAHFVVEKKYVVNVEAINAVSDYEGSMLVVVTANHINGNPVDGKVTVVISLVMWDLSHPPPIFIKTAYVFNGKVVIEFNVKNFYSINTYHYWERMNIETTVEEALTGVNVSATTRINNHLLRYTMRCTRIVDGSKGASCFSFEGGKKNDMFFQVFHINGSYVKNTASSVEFIYKEVLEKDYYSSVVTQIPPKSENHIVSVMGHMNDSGIIHLKVLLPDLPDYEGYLHYYSLEYKYMDEKRGILYTYPTREKKSTISVRQSFSNKKLLFNQPFQFTITSSEPLSYFIYNIISHRNIVKSVYVDLPDKRKAYNLTLTPEISWGPRFCVYVYYVDENNEFHYAEEKYFIKEPLNPITITTADHVRPGEEVAIKIKTAPNSFVGLMAVDQRALLLHGNNDFTPSAVESFIEDLSTHTLYQGDYSIYPGSISGCVTLTNGKYFYKLSNTGHAQDFGTFGDGFSPHKSSEAYATSFKDKSTGKRLWETWIFEDIRNSEAAEFTWYKKIPETNTTWLLTAFSLNPSNGLGVTEHVTKITTFA